MKKTWLLLLLLILSLPMLRAQTIRGVVYDRENKEPVFNATVYLEGTAIHASTDNNGRFELTSKRLIQTKLVVTHITYKKVLINDPFLSMPDTIFIEENENLLDEIVVSPKKNRFSREQLLKAFREQFLGLSRAAKSCTILNEDDIVIDYDLYSRTLSAYCSQPIEVENPFLGYTIRYEMSMFKVMFEGNSISYKMAVDFAMEGTPLFLDQAKRHKPTLRNRRNTYAGSKNHFFKSLRENTLKNNKFVMYHDRQLFTEQNFFAVEPADVEGVWRLTLIREQATREFVYFSQPHTVYFDMSISHRGNNTWMDLLTKELWLDYYGNFYPSKGIIFTGTFAERRLGDMLPLDYEPE